MVYNIEKKNYGYKITFGDTIKLEEMKKWCSESKSILKNQSGKFGVIVDLRTLSPLDCETQVEMISGQKEYKKQGMERSAVILASAIMTAQFKKLAQRSGIYLWEKYIDGLNNKKDWEKIAEDWIIKGIDPDIK